jgi:hypothetical protein
MILYYCNTEENGTLVWEYRYTNPGDDYPTDLKVDNSGNAFITGVKRAGNNNDIVVIKVNYSGAQEWTRAYGNSFDDISTGLILDHSQNVYVVGGVSTSSTNRETLLLQYNADVGTLLGSEVGSTVAASEDISMGITLDLYSNIIICSTISDNGANYYWKTVKYNPSPLMALWSDTFKGDNLYNEARIVRADQSGNIFVSGMMSDSFGDKTLTVLKYNASGALQWKNVYVSDTLYERTIPWAMELDNNDDIFIACSQVAGTDSSILVLRYSNIDGSISWLRRMRDYNLKGGKATDLKISKNNRIYVMGTARTTFGDTLKYVTGQYSDFYLNNNQHYDLNNKPDFTSHQLVIHFEPWALNMNRANRYDIEYGKSILTSSALNSLESQLGYSITNIYKVCPEFTTADSFSIARDGHLVPVPDIYDLMLITIPDDKNEIAAADSINKLNTLIKSAELNRIFLYDGPDDPQYSSQASLHATTAYPDANINIEDAWYSSLGTVVTKVAVIDNGIDWARKDLRLGFYTDTIFAHSKVSGYDFDNGIGINNDPGKYAGWHGTAVGGIIGANRNNNKWIAGIAGGDFASTNSGVLLFSMKSNGFNDTRLIRAIYDAAYNPIKKQINNRTQEALAFGVDVINLSAGFPAWTFPQSDDTDYYIVNPYPVSMYDAIGFAVNNGVIFVCSRGNEDDSADHFPATLPKNDWIISVGASETDGTRKSFSNISDLIYAGDTFGWPSAYGRKMDVIAPGTASLVLTLQDNFESVTHFTNTSAATPHVAGTAALIADYSKRILHDTLSPEAVQALIKLGAADKGPSGYDPFNGYGLLNAGKSVNFLDGNYKVVHYIIKNVYHPFVFTKSSAPNNDPVITVNSSHKYNTTDSVYPRQEYYYDPWLVSSTQKITPPSGYQFIAAWGVGTKSDALDWKDSMYLEINTGRVNMVPRVINTDHGYSQVYYFSNDTIKIKGYIYSLTKAADSSNNFINTFVSKQWKDTSNSAFQMAFDVLAVSTTIVSGSESSGSSI